MSTVENANACSVAVEKYSIKRTEKLQAQSTNWEALVKLVNDVYPNLDSWPAETTAGYVQKNIDKVSKPGSIDKQVKQAFNDVKGACPSDEAKSAKSKQDELSDDAYKSLKLRISKDGLRLKIEKIRSVTGIDIDSYLNK